MERSERVRKLERKLRRAIIQYVIPGLGVALAIAALAWWATRDVMVSGSTPSPDVDEPVLVTDNPTGAVSDRVDGESARTDLWRCVRAGSVKEARQIVERWPDILLLTDRHGKTALHLATRHDDVVAMLLAHGADVDARDDVFEETPLHWAVRRNRLHVVELLIEYGADVNARSAHGDTPLSIATRYGRSRIVAALAEAGADQ